MKPVWGQKAPPKHENGGKKRPQNHKVGAESAPTQIRTEKFGGKSATKLQSDGKSASAQISEKKLWWRKMPPNKQSDGKNVPPLLNQVEL